MKWFKWYTGTKFCPLLQQTPRRILLLRLIWRTENPQNFRYLYVNLCGITSLKIGTLIRGIKTPTRCKRWYLLQILLHAQHVSDNAMPIIRSSRVLYRWSLPVVFGALVFKLSVWCGAEGYVSGLQPANRTHNLQLHIIPTTWKPKHQIPQAATICIILSSSWLRA